MFGVRCLALQFQLKSARVTRDKLVRWAAASQPLRPMFAGAVSGVEAETGDDEKSVSATGVDGDPSSWATFGIGPQFPGWRGGIHPAD